MLVLGHPETGNPKDVTQQDSTNPQRTCLIGRCKDMMSSMDPTKALGMQEVITQKLPHLEQESVLTGRPRQVSNLAVNTWTVWAIPRAEDPFVIKL